MHNHSSPSRPFTFIVSFYHSSLASVTSRYWGPIIQEHIPIFKSNHCSIALPLNQTRKYSCGKAIHRAFVVGHTKVPHPRKQVGLCDSHRTQRMFGCIYRSVAATCIGSGSKKKMNSCGKHLIGSLCKLDASCIHSPTLSKPFNMCYWK